MMGKVILLLLAVNFQQGAEASVKPSPPSIKTSAEICMPVQECPKAVMFRYNGYIVPSAPSKPGVFTLGFENMINASCKVESVRDYWVGFYKNFVDCQTDAFEKNLAAKTTVTAVNPSPVDPCIWNWGCMGCGYSIVGSTGVSPANRMACATGVREGGEVTVEALKSCISKQRKELMEALDSPQAKEFFALVPKDLVDFKINIKDFSLVHEYYRDSAEALKTDLPAVAATSDGHKISLEFSVINLNYKYCHPVNAEQIEGLFSKIAKNPKSKFKELEKYLKLSGYFTGSEYTKFLGLVDQLLASPSDKLKNEENELIEKHQNTGSGYVKGKLLSPYVEPPPPPAPLLKPK